MNEATQRPDEIEVTDSLRRRDAVYCRRCGRELTNLDSYAAGMGPVCVTYFGICQKELARLNMAMDPNLVAAAMDDGPSIISLNNKGDRFVLRYKFDEDGSIRKEIKKIPGWNFDFKETKLWSIPATKEGMETALRILPQARIYVKDLERIKEIMEGRVKPTVRIPQEQSRLADFADGLIVMKFAKDFDLINRIKEDIPGRRWDPAKIQWTCPISYQAVETLKELNFQFTPALVAKIEVLTPKKVTDLKLPEGLKLYRFQEDGVKRVEALRGRAIIGDEMGLGKTVQALAWLRLHPEARPAVVVVPAVVKVNWVREANKWCPGEPVIMLSGKAGSDPDLLLQIAEHQDKAIIVVNYDILSGNGKAGWAEILKKHLKIQALIIDESHYIKNNKAQRTQCVKDLGKNVPYVIAMSGTPIINRPIEFYNAIRLVNPAIFPNWFQYANRYCAPSFNGFATNYNGASNTEELHRILSERVMIRRLKAEVRQDLPDKLRSVVPMEIDNRAEYRKAVRDFLSWLEETEGEEAAAKASAAEKLVSIGKLKQLAARGKLASVISWIREVLEQDEKLIVFCIHHWMVDAIYDEFKEVAVTLTGKDGMDKRQRAVDDFQADPKVRLFIGNIKAAGVGITLTAASHVAFLELGWTPGEHAQAEDRAHRIGQDKVVNIYYLVAERTIEEDIALLLDKKREVLSQVLDGKPVEKEAILTELLNKLKESRNGK